MVTRTSVINASVQDTPIGNETSSTSNIFVDAPQNSGTTRAQVLDCPSDRPQHHFEARPASSPWSQTYVEPPSSHLGATTPSFSGAETHEWGNLLAQVLAMTREQVESLQPVERSQVDEVVSCTHLTLSFCWYSHVYIDR